ncbi:MAG: lysylphosphatidylglycerol synthase domain-containing protein [Azospirillaceae bacterium]
MRRTVASLTVSVAITAGALAWLVHRGVFEAAGPALASADRVRLAGAFALVAVILGLRAWRFGLLLDGRPRLPGVKLIRVTAQLSALNFLLPFRLGELSFPVLARRSLGADLVDGAGVLLTARVLDLCVIAAILAVTGALLLPATGVPAQGALLWLGGGLALAAPFALVALGRRLAPVLGRLPRLGGLVLRLARGIGRLDGIGDRLLAVVLSWAIWLAFALLAWLAASAVVPATEPIWAMMAAAAGNLAFALPLNGVAGLGPAQAAWVAVMAIAGMPLATAALGALAVHAVALTGALALGALATVTGGRRDGPTAQDAGRPSISQP